MREQAISGDQGQEVAHHLSSIYHKATILYGATMETIRQAGYDPQDAVKVKFSYDDGYTIAIEYDYGIPRWFEHFKKTSERNHNIFGITMPVHKDEQSHTFRNIGDTFKLYLTKEEKDEYRFHAKLDEEIIWWRSHPTIRTHTWGSPRKFPKSVADLHSHLKKHPTGAKAYFENAEHIQGKHQPEPHFVPFELTEEQVATARAEYMALHRRV